MSNADRRRPRAREPHTAAVHLAAGRLVVICKCGQLLGGNRIEDATRITISDLVELTVAHSAQLGR